MIEPTPDADERLTLRQAAALLGTSTNALQLAIARGALPARREGRYWVVRRGDLAAYRARHATPPPRPRTKKPQSRTP
ncbi:MAG TPA: helix-turn-helix domain-containing protein [Thermomicrobiales bacterium]